MPTLLLKVDPDNSHVRLDVFVTQNLADIPSRTFVRKLIEAGQVTVNKKSVKPNYKVTEGDEVAVELSLPAKNPGIKAEKIPLDIFYEDDQLLIINKPAGLLVHPANAKNVSGTLVNALVYHCRSLSSNQEEFRPGIVHRLDRETSGLMVVAKDNKTHAKLAAQFESHEVEKKYLALVEGEVQFDEGMVDAALGRHPRHHDRKKVAYDDAAKEAATLYRVVKRIKGRTLIALYPKTGRTHQLRVHMAHLGHPILGDEKYGKQNSFPRLALHAQSIGFVHPQSGKFVEFSCRPPAEFLI